MIRWLVRRLLLTVPVLFGVATLVFALIHLVPGDPVQAMLGEAASPEDVARLRQRLGLDRPLLAQYGAFLSGLVTADLGVSLRTNEPVLDTLLSRLPATIELAAAALALAVTVALPLGVLSAVRARTTVDHAATVISLLALSMPNIWLGPVLALVFAVQWGWLPVSGRGTVAHVVLPAVTLGLPLAAALTRITRASVVEELGGFYVLAARARGVPRRRAVIRHAVRNSLIPIVTVLGLQAGSVLTGAVITETVFAWPGVGRLLVQSINFRDYPIVQGCVLLIAAIYVTVNLVVDLLYGVLDPRVRYE